MRHVLLLRIGGRQVIRIPRDFELHGIGAILRKDGERPIIEPLERPRDLREVLEAFPDIEDAPAVDEDVF